MADAGQVEHARVLYLEVVDALVRRHVDQPPRRRPAREEPRRGEPGDHPQDLHLAQPRQRRELLAVEGGGQRIGGAGKEAGGDQNAQLVHQ